jgi:hypothetical protein
MRAPAPEVRSPIPRFAPTVGKVTGAEQWKARGACRECPLDRSVEIAHCESLPWSVAADLRVRIADEDGEWIAALLIDDNALAKLAPIATAAHDRVRGPDSELLKLWEHAEQPAVFLRSVEEIRGGLPRPAQRRRRPIASADLARRARSRLLARVPVRLEETLRRRLWTRYGKRLAKRLQISPAARIHPDQRKTLTARRTKRPCSEPRDRFEPVPHASVGGFARAAGAGASRQRWCHSPRSDVDLLRHRSGL